MLSMARALSWVGGRYRAESVGFCSGLRDSRNAAPAPRFYVRDRLREVPPVAIEILCIVLTFTIHVIRRLRKDYGTRLSRALAVTQRVLDSNLHSDRVVGNDGALTDGEAAFPGTHLNSVICNAQPNGETKSLTEPFRCHARIGVSENRNYRARRNRTVGAHEYFPSHCQLSLAFSGRNRTGPTAERPPRSALRRACLHRLVSAFRRSHRDFDL